MTHSFILLILIIPLCLAEVWIIHVYTGNEQFSGTDSNIYIRLFNSKDESTGEYQLTHSNWISENHDLPIRNLFETGAHERFHIRTEDIGSVGKIHIRHNNFPPLQADWLLDKVIVERDQGSTKYTFKCNCWLRKPSPYVTLTALPDPSSVNRNKGDDTSSANNRTLVIILVILITLITCIFCTFNEYRRRQRHPSMFLDDSIQSISQEPAFLDTYHPEPLRPPSSSSDPQYWLNTLRRWKNYRQDLPSYNHARATPSVTAPLTVPADEPPSYDDLYPNSTTPISTNVAPQS